MYLNIALEDEKSRKMERAPSEIRLRSLVEFTSTTVPMATNNPEAQGSSAPVKPALRKPVFTKKGRAVSPNLRNVRIAECLVGDETGTILFTARNDQVDLMKPGAGVIIRNGKIDMFKGSMRLAVDRWGRIEVTDPVTFEVKEDNNLSLVEYELVSVAE
ncbi:unnamed protein product [Lactuca saligna]|uniref:Single-stranded DNA binding protein Ssb-like OB fold domain-containing protein n=1 Tax=Lactuca saligna TaxID=75948 RepID=A0AA36E7Z6_LACSI|nr:unnamed protein product [Lactuca saligna]